MSEDAGEYRPLTMDDWCDVGRVAKRCCPHCYDRVLKERDAARALAREYYKDIQQRATDYEWDKSYVADAQIDPWLLDGLM